MSESNLYFLPRLEPEAVDLHADRVEVTHPAGGITPTRSMRLAELVNATGAGGLILNGNDYPTSDPAAASLIEPILAGVMGNLTPWGGTERPPITFPQLGFVSGELYPQTYGDNPAGFPFSFPALTYTGGLQLSDNGVSPAPTYALPRLATVAGQLSINYSGDFPPENQFPALTAIYGELNVYQIAFTPLLRFPQLAFATAIFVSTSEFERVSFPALLATDPGGGGINFDNCPSLATVELPLLASVDTFNFYLLPQLASFPLPQLVRCQSCQLNELATLASIYLPRLSILGPLYLSSCPELPSLRLPAITEIEIIYLDQMASLTDFRFGEGLRTALANLGFLGTPLDTPSVDHILIRLAALDGTQGTTSYDGMAVELADLCAPPSTAGLAAKATLEARGCSVTVNV